LNTDEENVWIETNNRASRLMKDRRWVCKAVDKEFPNIAIEGDDIVQLITDAVLFSNEALTNGGALLRIHFSTRPFWDVIRKAAWVEAEKEVLS